MAFVLGLNLLNGAKPSSKNEALFFIGTNNDPNYDENTTAELGLATQVTIEFACNLNCL